MVLSVGMETNALTAKLPTMRILWGRKAADAEWAETVLCTQPERFAAVRGLAAKDGWGFFRESVDDGSGPDFAKTLRRSSAS